MSDDQMNPKDVERLLHAILPPVRDYLAEQPPGKMRPFSVLNALAATAAVVIAGAPDPQIVRDWFIKALDDNAIDTAEIAPLQPSRNNGIHSQ